MLASGFLVAWLGVAPDIQQGHLVIQLKAVCLLAITCKVILACLSLPCSNFSARSNSR